MAAKKYRNTGVDELSHAPHTNTASMDVDDGRVIRETLHDAGDFSGQLALDHWGKKLPVKTLGSGYV